MKLNEVVMCYFQLNHVILFWKQTCFDNCIMLRIIFICNILYHNILLCKKYYNNIIYYSHLACIIIIINI